MSLQTYHTICVLLIILSGGISSLLLKDEEKWYISALYSILSAAIAIVILYPNLTIEPCKHCSTYIWGFFRLSTYSLIFGLVGKHLIRIVIKNMLNIDIDNVGMDNDEEMRKEINDV